jgi:hypothetical protein
MDPKLAIELLRAGLGALAAVRAWRATASPDQLKAFVEGVHAQGGTVDLAVADQVIADTLASGAALDAKLAGG